MYWFIAEARIWVISVKVENESETFLEKSEMVKEQETNSVFELCWHR
jgi:hypothetical protein